MITIDKLCYSSGLRYKSPFIKAGLAVGLLLICVFARSIALSLIILLLMGSLTVLVGKASLKRYWQLMLVPLAFLLLSTFAIAVNLSPMPLSSLAIPLGSLYITVSRAGVMQCLGLVSTALAAVSCLYFLTLTTPLTDILLVLRRCKCPYLIIELMMLIYRFIFVLLELASSLYRAQACRLGHKDLRTAWDSIGKLMAVLLLRAMQKSNRLYDAMESRCYNGVIRVLDEYIPAGKAESLGVIVILLFFLALAIFFNINGF